jgi:hypothetical protein
MMTYARPNQPIATDKLVNSSFLFSPTFSLQISPQKSTPYQSYAIGVAMGKILDTEKLGSVFGTRPDILQNIQKAAGKQNP